MKTLLILLALSLMGCGQTIYDRQTLTIAPDGTATFEHVHIGSTSLATAKTLEGLAIRTDRGEMALNGATIDNDSIKATTPYGILETKGK